jgi:glycogen operon protein
MRHPALRRRTFFGTSGPTPDIVWHGTEPLRPDFSAESRAIALALDGRRADRHPLVDRDFYMMFNASWEPLEFRVAASPTGRAWRRTVDTALPSPDDALGLDLGPVIPVLFSYRAQARSMVILVSEAGV